jgi:hypothetical protein
MVMHGQVEEGLDLLHRAGNPTTVSRGGVGPASGHVARMTLFATSVQLGQPDLALDLVPELTPLALNGSPEAAMALGMQALQHGDLDLAAGFLFRDENAPAGANLRAGRALVAAFTGRGDVAAQAELADLAEGTTYMDRGLVAMARAVHALRHPPSDPDAADELRRGAVAGLEASLADIRGTGDVVAQATFALVAAGLGHALGSPDMGEAEAAEGALAALGIDAAGWRRVLDLARTPAVA